MNRPSTTDMRSRQRKLKDAKVLNIPEIPMLEGDKSCPPKVEKKETEEKKE